MAEENKQPAEKKTTDNLKEDIAMQKNSNLENTVKKESKDIDKKVEAKPEEKEKEEKKPEDKKVEAKPAEVKKTDDKQKTSSESKDSEKPKKTEAKVNATSLPISTKHAMAILNMIRNKQIDSAISLLDLAEKKKIPVPMRGEIPHRKGKGMMSGRYPVNALGHIIKVLKSLKSNALVNELELEKYKIFCKANVAARPYRRFGKGRFKKTHVNVKLIPITKEDKMRINKARAKKARKIGGKK